MKLRSLVLATVVKTKNLNIKLGFRILSIQGEFQMLHLFLFVCFDMTFITHTLKALIM